MFNVICFSDLNDLIVADLLNDELVIGVSRPATVQGLKIK